MTSSTFQADVTSLARFEASASPPHEDVLEAMRVGRTDEFGCCCEQRWHELSNGDALTLDIVDQLLRIADDVRWRNVQHRT